MRHYQSKVQKDNVYHVSADCATRWYPKLLEKLEPHLDRDARTSNEVRDTLKEWCNELTLSSKSREYAANGVFLYANLNSGISIVFIADYGYGDFAGRSLW